jgi:hypothetical protein
MEGDGNGEAGEDKGRRIVEREADIFAAPEARR